MRTAEWLSRHTGPVILVNQATPRIEELYRKLGYDVRFLEAPRKSTATATGPPAKEILGTRHL